MAVAVLYNKAVLSHLTALFAQLTAPRPGRWRWPVVLAALLAGLALQWCYDTQPLRGADYLIQDQLVRWRASDQPETRVAVVDIDEATLTELEPWPWRRSTMADLVEILLADYAVRAVALDFVFPQSADPAGDARLQALAAHAPVVFSQAFDYVPRVPALRIGVLGGGVAAPAPGVAVPATGFIANHPAWANARCTGNIGLLPDADGAIRRLPLWTAFEQSHYEPLSVALARCAGQNLLPTQLDANGFWPLPYRKTWLAYTVVSAKDLFSQKVPKSVLAGRLVLLGSSSFGLSDRVVTPLDRSTAGVMVHAAALSDLLSQQPGSANYSAPDDGRWWGTLWIVALAVMGALVFSRLAAFWSVALLATASLAWLGLCFWLLPFETGYSPTAPLVTALLLLLLAVPYEWRQSQLQSKHLLKNFRHYVAQPVLDELLRQDRLDALEPRFLQVTTLIADLQGYAGLVENAPLREAVALTRDFLECLTRPVLAHNGTLDKYTGDGLVSFWGAPLPSFDHADQALDAALDMLAAVKQFNLQRTAAGKPPVRVRIGIETGLAVAGDLGTQFRGAYTAVGDSVNVASRLQELARNLPHDILAGPGTAALTKRHAMHKLGQIEIRGRQRAIEIFTLQALR